MRVTAEQLQEFIDLNPPEQGQQQPRQRSLSYSGSDTGLDVQDYLSKYGVESTGTKQHGDSTLYLLKTCPFDSSHKNEASIGQTVDGKLFFQCFHNSCQDRTWKEARQAISGDEPLFSRHLDSKTKQRIALDSTRKAKDSTGKHPESECPDPLPIKSELPPVEPLTEEMILEPFRAWVLDAANRMQVPPDYIIAPLLVVCGSIVGTSCRIRPKQRDDWTVTPNLWGGIVGPPSILKTPALNEAVNKMLGRLEATAREEQEQAVSEYEATAMIGTAKVKAIKAAIEKAAKLDRDGKNKGKSLDELAEELQELQSCRLPTERRYKTNDSSIEKIVELLEQNPNGLLYFRDELIGLFKRMERNGNEQDRAFLLESWNGDGSHTDDRIGRGTVRTDNLCISLLGGIQPDRIAGYLRGAINDGDNDGFVQRLQLLVYPDPIANWKYQDKYPDTEAKNRAYAVVEWLAARGGDKDE